jgi:nicotinate-nucleotide adenylyltransferase
LQAQARLEPLTMASDEPLALLGGTFDPVHYGHLRLADEVSRALAPIEVRLVPARDPPHRGAPHASAAHRLAMLRLAQQEFPELVVDAREIERPGKSYTVLTLEGLRAEMPARPLVLIVGADQLLALTAWHRWQALFDLAHLLVVARPGVSLAIDALEPHLRQEWTRRCTADVAALRARPSGAIAMQPVTPQPISATAIRQALAEGGTDAVRGLLPPAVLAYIRSNRLYGPPPDAA